MYDDLDPHEYSAISNSLEQVIEVSYQSIRGLFILNGGGTAVLMTFLGSVLDKQNVNIYCISIGLIIMASGIVFATIAQILRYQSRLWFLRSGAVLYPFRMDVPSNIDRKKELRTGNKFVIATTVFIFLSLISFISGVIFVYLSVV